MPSDEQIVREMGDLLRYTVVADHDDLVAVTKSFVNGFQVVDILSMRLIISICQAKVHIEVYT